MTFELSKENAQDEMNTLRFQPMPLNVLLQGQQEGAVQRLLAVDAVQPSDEQPLLDAMAGFQDG